MAASWQPPLWGWPRGHPQLSGEAARPRPVVGDGDTATPSGRGWPRDLPRMVWEGARPPSVVGDGRAAASSGRGWPRGLPQVVGEGALPPPATSGGGARPSPRFKGVRAATPVVREGRAAFPKWLGVAHCHPRQPQVVARGQPLNLKVAARPHPRSGVAPPATYGGGSAPPPLRGGCRLLYSVYRFGGGTY